MKTEDKTISYTSTERVPSFVFGRLPNWMQILLQFTGTPNKIGHSHMYIQRRPGIDGCQLAWSPNYSL